ncbi:ABC transporter ATP-binding protein [Halioxenophilus aromaticivorans]|uniref:ABC transporter domain-containing protein n=1 Tax=Halioxenophilus aromaticivorans TaxID=1306992 RepID=A0AAV3U040_9ALTE
MKKPVLKFDNVSLFYKNRLGIFGAKNWVIKDLTFDLLHGEVLGVIGKNGAGKSTLLRLLADIIAPNSGRIWREENTRAQLLTLNLGFIQDLNGVDNIVLSLVSQGLPIKHAKSLIETVTDYAELAHVIRQPLRTYSAGQKARLGFAIALQATPDVLLLDEILGVGDKDFQEKSSKALAEVVQSEQTVVLVSHSSNTIEKYCQRTLWIEQGSCKMLGETSDVLDAYHANQATAQNT